MKVQVDNILDAIRREEGELDSCRKRKTSLLEQQSVIKRQSDDIEKIRTIVQTVAKATQRQVQNRISSVVTTALRSVFPEPYDLLLEFEPRRNKTEAVISLRREGSTEKINAMTAAGGGVVDLTAFALRLCVWSIQRNRTRNVLLLDEPFKFVSRDLIPYIGTLLREVSRQLDVQLIIITHDKAIANEADKTYEVSLVKDGKGNRVSEVVERPTVPD